MKKIEMTGDYTKDVEEALRYWESFIPQDKQEEKDKKKYLKYFKSNPNLIKCHNCGRYFNPNDTEAENKLFCCKACEYGY